MSLSEDLSNSSPRGPTNAKRAACDRCRGQKLRCLSEDSSQDSPCVRCFKAGAICSFGKPKRLGRPPASSTTTPRERRGNTGGKSRQGSTGNGGGQAGSLEGKAGVCWDGGHQLAMKSAVDEGSDAEADDTAPAYTLCPSSLQDTSSILARVNLSFSPFAASSTTALPWPDETLPPLFEDGSTEVSALESFHSKYGWGFPNQQVQPADLHMLTTTPRSDDDPSRNLGISVYGVPTTNAHISQVPDEAMDLDVPTQVAHASPVNSIQSQPTRRLKSDSAQGSSSSFGLDSIMNSASFHDMAEIQAGPTSWDGGEGLSAPQVQHRRMQELSELAMDLYVQLAAHDPEKQQHTPSSSATADAVFDVQLFGSVLKSSSTFLSLLTSFSASNDPSKRAAHHHHRRSTRGSSDSGGCSPPASTREDHPDALDAHAQPAVAPLDPSSLLLSALAPANSANNKPPRPTDMTTVLQLLSCYIRLIHLHSIMYTHLLNYTRAFVVNNGPSSSLPSSTQQSNHLTIPPVFPNLQIGGASLDAFGAFQVAFLLQVTVHVLGEIEVALGLPAEYRVGKCKGGGRGVLEASVSGGFVTCLMREGAWSEKRVEGMRGQLGALREVLGAAMEL